MTRSEKILLALVLLGIFAVQYAQLSTLKEMARSALFNHMTDPATGEFVSAWKCATAPNGIAECRTLRQPGQSVADWNANHLARRAQMLIDYPPDS